MGSRNRNIDLLAKRIFLPYTTGSIVADFATMTAAAAAVAEIGATDLGSIKFDAAGEEVAHWWQLPFDLDVQHAIKFRVHYAWDSTTATDDATWKVFYNSPLSAAALAKPATALSTAIAEHRPGTTTAKVPVKTGWGQLAANTFNRTQCEEGHLLPLLVEFDAGDYTANIYYIGLEIEYMPLVTVGLGNPRRRTSSSSS